MNAREQAIAAIRERARVLSEQFSRIDLEQITEPIARPRQPAGANEPPTKLSYKNSH